MLITLSQTLKKIFLNLCIINFAKMSNQTRKSTAGIIIIGDEILKGQTRDTNSYFLSQRLYKLGVRLEKISVIPDDLTVISEEVKEFSTKYDFVITSGGIGPTHDDKTFEGVALAFNDELYQNQEILDISNEYIRQKNSKDSSKEAILKMSFIPSSSTLKYAIDIKTGKNLKFPLVVVNNVYIFPGIPGIMERAFIGLEHLFRNENIHQCLKEYYFSSDELSIANTLTKADKLYGNKVVIGSYPETVNPYYKVKVTLDSTDDKYICEISDFFKQNIPSNFFTTYDPHQIMNAADKVYSLAAMDSVLGKKVASSLNIIEEAFCRYKVNETIVGFNGGKDCTALLHLVYAVLQKNTSSPTTNIPFTFINGFSPPHKENFSPWTSQEPEFFNAFFIRKGRSFPEMELFVKQTINRYPIKSMEIEGAIKEGLLQLKKRRPNITAVFMGTRSSDPSGANLAEFQMTDPGWPEYMRINPILDWSYSTVWSFIRQLSLPYCSLYDVGYTSIGSLENTHPNPALRIVNESGVVSYEPAYLLSDEGMERNGRN